MRASASSSALVAFPASALHDSELNLKEVTSIEYDDWARLSHFQSPRRDIRPLILYVAFRYH